MVLLLPYYTSGMSSDKMHNQTLQSDNLTATRNVVKDHNPCGCQVADELGVMQQGLIFLGQGVYAVLNSGIFLCEYQSVPEIVGLKIRL